jgi:hypothetical protein
MDPICSMLIPTPSYACLPPLPPTVFLQHLSPSLFLPLDFLSAMLRILWWRA